MHLRKLTRSECMHLLWQVVGSQLLAIMDGELPVTGAEGAAASTSGGGGLMEGHSWIAEAGDDVAETFAVSLAPAAPGAAQTAITSAEPSTQADGNLLSQQHAHVEGAETTALPLPPAALGGSPIVPAPSPEVQRSGLPAGPAPTAAVSLASTAAPHTAGAAAVPSASDAGTVAGVAAPLLTSAAAVPAATASVSRTTLQSPHEQASAAVGSGTQDVPSEEPALAALAPAAGSRPAATMPQLAPPAVRFPHP